MTCRSEPTTRAEFVLVAASGHLLGRPPNGTRVLSLSLLPRAPIVPYSGGPPPEDPRGAGDSKQPSAAARDAPLCVKVGLMSRTRDLSVSLERTMCYGPCPVYTVTL